MTHVPSPRSVELEGEYYHVRFHDPSDFAEIRTPEWARAVAEEVSSGSRVRTGRRSGSDDWVVQSVLLPKSAGKSTARSDAVRIAEKLDG
jgi:hypothetical protein